MGILAFASTVVVSETGKDFQNKYAAIAALAVQRFKTVEHGDKKGSAHEEKGGDGVRLLKHFRSLRVHGVGRKSYVHM